MSPCASKTGRPSPLDASRCPPSDAGQSPTLTRAQFEATLNHLDRDTEAAVLMVEVGGIARINRALGHSAGDAILDELRTQLEETMPTARPLSRFDSGRFVALFTNLASEVQAVNMADQVVDLVRGPRFVGDLQVRLTANVGISFAGARPAELLRDVDLATQRAKQRGSNQIEVFRTESRRKIVRELKLEAELCEAFEREELRIHFQPIVSLHRPEVTAIEALVRWEHPRRGLIPPDRFIPAAEKSGLITDIGDWVLAQVCSRIAQWGADDPAFPCPPVSINVSARQLGEGTLDSRLSTALLATGVRPASIMLEITESSAMELQRGPLEMLSKLKRIGVKVLLDDFGTGYSSLAWLSRLPIDGLKIDRAFVNQISTLTDPMPILAAVVDMGRALGLTIVGEGVETSDQLKAVQGVGADAVQGYFLAHPKPIESSRDLRVVLEAASSRSTTTACYSSRAAKQEELIPLGAAADLLDVSPSTVRRLADRGAVPTTRTRGGHRRFPRQALERFAQQRLGAHSLPPRKLPTEPLSHAARHLRDDGPALIDQVCRTMYEGSRGGWFATADARTRTSLWLESFSETLARGNFRDAIDVTASFLVVTASAGASMAECIRFLTQFGQVVARDVLRSGGGATEEARGIQRVTGAAMESFLERIDR